MSPLYKTWWPSIWNEVQSDQYHVLYWTLIDS
jgi:hypothetical protein